MEWGNRPSYSAKEIWLKRQVNLRLLNANLRRDDPHRGVSLLIGSPSLV